MPSKGRPENNNKSRNYCPFEIDIIRKNLDKSNEEIAGELRREGYERSVDSIKQKKHQEKMKKEYGEK